MSGTTNSLQLDHLDSRMRTVWRRGQTLHLTAGILACWRWAIPLFLTGVIMDWLVDVPAAGRGMLLITLLAISLYQAWRCGWRNLRAFNATYTALQLEAHHGGLDSLLVSAVQLRDPKAVAGVSESLRNKTCRLAEEAASILRPEKAVPFRGLRRPATIALLLAGLIGICAVAGGPFFTAGLSRIFAPWLAVAYPTYTRLDLGAGDLVVKQGASAQIKARVSGIVPNTAKLLLRTGEGRPREIILDITDGTCTYTIASASRDFSYQIKAGDARSALHQVRVIPAPRIEQVKVDLQFPAYLERASETVEALTLTVPEGTGINWQLTLDRPVRNATFLRDGEKPLELHVSEDGLRVKFNAMASDSRGYCFEWVEKERGFDFTSSRYYLQVASDQPPRVELTSPATNLSAMLGRPLDLIVRAQDDHAIATAEVTYRVNRRQDESVELPSRLRNGEGEQSIDWDYRTALPDLDIGDTVSFAVEVSDHYPGPPGPHHTRSETRRITFLSKEEYLEQIARKIDRLLSRVRSLYRQERAAHELVLKMDPGDNSFRQTCQLEAVRQEMIRSQLNDTAGEVQALLDDLAANNVSDAAAGASLEKVRLALLDIAASHIAQAASLLRDQSGAAEGNQEAEELHVAARAINTAARELGSLVLLRDIDAAHEVYAREARMLAQAQAYVRWRTVADKTASPQEELAEQQDELAIWTDRLISDLQKGLRYDKRPLAVLRLIRSVKDLRGAQTEEKMRQAGTFIRQGKAELASGLQADLVRILLNAEFSVRLSGAYSTLLQTRDDMVLLAQHQTQLRGKVAGLSSEEFEAQWTPIALQQTRLRRQLLTILLPSIPAPRAQLFDEALPLAPPVEAMLAEADRAMAEAVARITADQQDAAADQQRNAEQALVDVTQIVDRWSVEMGLQTQGLSTLVAATSERLSRIEEFEARIIGLLEKTDIAAAENEKVDELAEPQLILADELARFHQDLGKRHQAEPDQDLPPLLSRLHESQRAMSAAVQSLSSNAAEEAIENQEQAADALAEAYAIVVAQNERLGLLQDLLMFQRAVGFANGYMADIVAEQQDLLTTTETADAKDLTKLLPVFANLRTCMEDVAPLLDLVAGRLDVGTPLVFARTDFEDAMAAVENGDTLEAIDAQDVAAESLEEVQALIQAVQTQTGYVAEIVEYLHRATSNVALTQYQQEELRKKLATAEEDQLTALAEEQRALLAQAENDGRQFAAATGMPEFTEPSTLMREALAQWEAGDAAAAADQLELASVVLAENAEALFAVIRVLHGLPSIEVNTQTTSELVRLVDVLAAASSHTRLFRQTQAAAPQALDGLEDQQRDLAQRCLEIAQSGPPHALLAAARDHLSEAVSAFESSDPQALRRSQQAAVEQLRHFIIEQALILDTAKPPAVATEGDPTADGEGSDSESAFTAGFISDFVSGEAPKDKRTEWKVLGDRTRAALNQNFARELPLEYRGLLKNYYERVAK